MHFFFALVAAVQFSYAGVPATVAQATAQPVATPTPIPPPRLNVWGKIDQGFVVPGGSGWQNGAGTYTKVQVIADINPYGPRARYTNVLSLRDEHTRYVFFAQPANFDAYWNESDIEDDIYDDFGPMDEPWGIGAGYWAFNINDAGEHYHLYGLGIGIDKWANNYQPVSWYGSLWFYPNMLVSATDANNYGIVRYDLGLNVRPHASSTWNVRVGFSNDSWYGTRYGGNVHFTGGYAGITYWRP